MNTSSRLSHILSELADFCTSIGIIERGKLLAAGSIQEIKRKEREKAGKQEEITVLIKEGIKDEERKAEAMERAGLDNITAHIAKIEL